MPFRYNTFDGRLLWFDGVEGKRGLTLTGFVFVVVVLFVCFGGGGGRSGRGGSNCFIGAYWCLWHSMRLTNFRHYYFPKVLSVVT